MEGDILQTLWLQRFPVNLQQILLVCKAPTDELVQIAHKIHEVSGGNLTIANVVSKGPDLNAVLAEIAERKEMVKGAFSPQLRSRSRSASQSKSVTSFRPKNNKKDLFWYHRKFRNRANRCVLSVTDRGRTNSQ
ncbi:uncharacterized protein NPIL_270831 [Nephila pilipes]|uniref:Uncharacterized protein n=1 Tax=Nephila pilipes TaxID=299642 RepID=A0A8X6MBW2_NEPPI|nr:uncharacterized protein NPIL_270831 [Nephila pilipes]